MSTDKSYVGTGHEVCIVCGQKCNEVVLLDRRLKDTLERDMCIGVGMCEEHAKLRDEGYIAIVGCDPERTAVVPHAHDPDDDHNKQTTLDTVKIGEEYRTGDVIHIKSTAFANLFSCDVPEGKVMFAEQSVLQWIKDAHRTQRHDDEQTH